MGSQGQGRGHGDGAEMQGWGWRGGDMGTGLGTRGWLPAVGGSSPRPPQAAGAGAERCRPLAPQHGVHQHQRHGGRHRRGPRQAQAAHAVTAEADPHLQGAV